MFIVLKIILLFVIVYVFLQWGAFMFDLSKGIDYFNHYDLTSDEMDTYKFEILVKLLLFYVPKHQGKLGIDYLLSTSFLRRYNWLFALLLSLLLIFA